MSAAIVRYKAARAELIGSLEKQRDDLARIMPSGMVPERLIQVVKAAVTRNPAILDCDLGSIVRSVYQGAECGLEIGGTFGEAYLVPFWDRKRGAKLCQFIAGYKGLIKLACEHERVRNVEAELVYSGDRFVRVKGTQPKLVHEPAEGGDESIEKITHAYAVAFFVDGGNQFEVMTRARLDEIRDRSKARDRSGKLTGPWATDTRAMYRKTPVRSLMRFLPLTPRAQKALEYDQEAALSHPARTAEGATRTDDLKSKLKGETSAEPEAEIADAEFEEIVEALEKEEPST